MNFWDLLFDRRCSICGKSIDKGSVCDDCDKELEKLINVRNRKLCVEGSTLNAYYLFEYDNVIVKKLLFALKRRGNKELFEYAANLYYKAVPDDFIGCVTSVPRRGIGRRSYGYDQVEVPCKIMCKQQKERLEYKKLLCRTGFSKEQKNLNEKQRKANTKGKFKAVKKDIPKNILVADDCVTTGSTVISCVTELVKKNEDANVSFIFLASQNVFTRE